MKVDQDVALRLWRDAAKKAGRNAVAYRKAADQLEATVRKLSRDNTDLRAEIRRLNGSIYRLCAEVDRYREELAREQSAFEQDAWNELCARMHRDRGDH